MEHTFVIEGDSGRTNGSHSSSTNGHKQHINTRQPLTILIAGAGIGGLTAAIALRQQGHNVTVFEQSRFASEVGAAVHLAPNSNGILRRLGIFAETFGANTMNRLTEADYAGNVQKSIDLRKASSIWQYPWHLAHRAHLHKYLKDTATSVTGSGAPVALHTSSQVKNVDEGTATITLENGESVQGDVIIGADGVHSVTRSRVAPVDVKPFSCGKSAFRFLVLRQAIKADPSTAHLVEDEGELKIWYAQDRRIVMYPTSNHTELNFVAIHPEHESNASSDWNEDASLDTMLKVYATFDPAVIAMISKADPASFKAWGHLALIGDAAHPFLPHQGQGAGAAIEDAATIATVLPLGTTRDEIPERLQLYDQIRHECATKIQTFSRLIGSDDFREKNLDMFGFTNFNFGHDEFDNSRQKFREYQWSRVEHTYSRMPIAFGPMPGPRQDHYGRPRDGSHSTFTTASIRFKTSRTALQNLFPPGRSGYSFSAPGTIAYASFSQTTLINMAWLGGGGYNHLGLYIHGVTYTKPYSSSSSSITTSTTDPNSVSGTYMPILFESLADPIVSGREELGMPKLYSEIDLAIQGKTSYHIKTHWRGAQWGSFTLSDLMEQDTNTANGSISGDSVDKGIIVHRYMPAVGREFKGFAEGQQQQQQRQSNIPTSSKVGGEEGAGEGADYAVFDEFSQASPQPHVRRMWKAGRAKFEFEAGDWNNLPTLHHVVERLAELPVYEIMEAKVVEGLGVPDVSGAKRV
ncbi:Putative FAD-binding domain, acetoacetate decarboxylase, FAD/NAD(P)-binding domain superfamily [Septoria linicola]|uniref:FAD-binding domain, acetoacetate decarboxylase, FAD/NAD(P)-binding domain superfamily n=1 Tax=Septoria linicola TaxID=215465 RepID=A0A9Q9ENQ0_9PEZI|nr:putative FAD-binding domain, acetoacetate decarboxylase, FAD/NAD(P)-binding domain superfamily [Septoria linicola]USW56867.1 Putative FAD-binding domain, acetoacetate decarboxylase, FAD/NAD(P)-binding domain superfamily [Septoria linicola]